MKRASSTLQATILQNAKGRLGAAFGVEFFANQYSCAFTRGRSR